MHLLNQGDGKGAIAGTGKTCPHQAGRAGSDGKGPQIDAVAAKRLNVELAIRPELGGQTDELLPAEKLEILDAQGTAVAGVSALRLEGDLAGATDALRAADAKVAAVRNGRVSICGVDARANRGRSWRDRRTVEASC